MVMKLQHEADLGKPEERFVWALRGIEFNGMPVAFPEEILKTISKHLSKAGAVHISQVDQALAGEDAAMAQRVLSRLPQQEIHYQPPIKGQDHALNTSGEWKPVSEPIRGHVVPMVDSLTPQEKARLIAELREEGSID